MRTALITGGGRGIGRAIAERLAHDGFRIVVTGRTESELAEVAGASRGQAIVADLLDRASVEEICRRAGDVDVLVNNAGIADSASLEKTPDELWDRTMELNATAPFRLCRALVPAMVKRGWGRVVNLASNAGVSGYAYTAAYCASKHALVGMTRALAVDLARTGVTVNAICPGWVETRMVEEAAARIAKKTQLSAEDAKQTLANMSPQRRMIQPEEVAHVVAMLCEEEARGIHGQALVIDGGAVMK